MPADELKQLLEHSLDMQYYRLQLTIFAIVQLITLICFCPVFFVVEISTIIFLLLFIVVLYSPFVIYYLLRMRGLKYQAEDYVIFEAVLTNPHPGFMRGMIYFTVEYQDRNGITCSLDTRAIFQSSMWGKFCFDTYQNKKALLAYNDTTGQLVILKTVL